MPSIFATRMAAALGAAALALALPHAGAASFGGAAPAPAAAHPSAASGRLENGLTYAVERTAEEGVRVRLVVKVGDAYGFPKRQVAHVLEHLVFDAPEIAGRAGVKQQLASWGADPASANAGTGVDRTSYFFALPAWNADQMRGALGIVHDWIAPPDFDDAAIERARRAVIEEGRRTPPAFARQLAAERRLWFRGSPLAGWALDSEGELSADVAAIQALAATWHRPANMMLIVTGNVDPAAVVPLIRAALGGMPLGSLAPSTRPDLRLRLDGANRTLVEPMGPKEAVKLSLVFKRHRAPKAEAAHDRAVALVAKSLLDDAAANLFARYAPPVIGGGFNPDDDAYGSAAGVTFFKADFELERGGVAEGLKEIFSILETVRRRGFAPADIERVREALLREATAAEPGDAASARWEGRFIEGGEDPPSDAVRRALAKLTAADFNRRLARWLALRNRDLILFVPEGVAAPSHAAVIDALWKRAATAPTAALTVPALQEPLLSEAPPAVDIGTGRAHGERFVWTLPRSGARLIYTRKQGTGAIRLLALRPGGPAALPARQRSAGFAALEVVPASGLGELDQFALARFLGPRGIAMAPLLADDREGLNGSGPPERLDLLAALMREQIARPQCREEALRDLVQRGRNMDEENLTASSFANFVLAETGRIARPGRDAIETLALGDICAAYRAILGDTRGMTIVAEGDLAPERVAAAVGRYLDIEGAGHGAGPGGGVRLSPVAETTAGRSVMRAGAGTRATVSLVVQRRAAGDAPRLAALARSVLEQRLLARLRGVEAGTYAVYVSVVQPRFPGAVRIMISFDCDASRADALATAAGDELDKLRADGLSEADWETYRSSVREPAPSLADMADAALAGVDAASSAEIDRDSFNAWLRQYLDPATVRSLIRLPI